MPRIVAEKGPDRGSTWSIREEGVLLIGRDTGAQIALRDEETSRRHCQLEFRSGQWLIRDLESTNGVLVNGEEITTPTILKHNDHIEVGVSYLTFLTDDDPLLGEVIGGCKVEQRIGRGGMGTVYRARQKSLDRPVALKILSEKYTSNPQFIDLFIREARAAGRLSHPHIVQVYDVGHELNQHFFTMELVAGGSVEKIIDETGAISINQALRFVRDAALGLEYAEKQGIVHRDIKPGNLMLSSNGVVKIGDLGIARKTDETGVVSQKDGVSGSPHYIAPEQARGEPIDQRADIYSLGATLFHCLAGRTPYRGAGAKEVILKHIEAKGPPSLIEMAPETPLQVCQLVERMMSASPEDRPANAQVLGKELDDLIFEFGSRNEPDESKLRTVRFWRATLLLFILLVVVSSISLYMFDQQKTKDQEIQRTKDQLQKHRSNITQQLDLADSAVRRGEPDSAEEILLSLDTIPDDLQDRIQDLETTIDQERLRIDSLSREEKARSTLAEILSTSESSSTNKQKLEQLRQLSITYQGTRSAQRAQEEIAKLEQLLAKKNDLEARAKVAWEQALAKAEGWRSASNPARAREEILSLSDEFTGTPSWSARALFLSQLEQEAAQLWATAHAEIKTLLQQGRIVQADDIIDGVVSRALLPTTRDLESILREEVKIARTALEAANTPKLGPVIREGWGRWKKSFSGKEAVEVLQDSALRDGLPEEAMKTIDQHVRFLLEFDQKLRSWDGTNLPVIQTRILKTSSNSTISAPHVRIDQERVSYKESSTGIGRYLLWRELAIESRLDLLLEAGPPDLLVKHVIALLVSTERTAEAAPLWSQLEQRVVTEIKELLLPTHDSD
ncbi:MAG: protein kinase [Planctomycetota bacterium]